MKSLEDRLSRAVEKEDFLAVNLAKGDLEREASKSYNRVPNEAVKRNVFARKEVFQRSFAAI